MHQPPLNLAGWVAFLGQADIPVLKQTARDLARLRENRDDLDARQIAAIVTRDPLMTVKLLRYMQGHKRLSQMQELVQVDQAIMMMGLNAFFTEIPTEPMVENVLARHMNVLVHLMQTVRRAQRSADYAFDWALRLRDLHWEEVRVSALLTYVGEMLMWCFNPEHMLEIRKRQDADRTLRSADVQKQVLGFVGMDLQRALTVEWNLPALLMNLMDPKQARNPRVRNVLLAVNLARHSSHGWHNSALPDDLKQIGELLRMEPVHVMEIVGAPAVESPADQRAE
jgi:HD-like signal output (HDOD) protein